MWFWLLVGCSSGPPSTHAWDGVVRTKCRITADPDFHDLPALRSGERHVLTLGARWGKLPLITDTEQYLYLGITVPKEWKEGETLDASNRRGFFRIGNMGMPYYESHELEGAIAVVEVEGDSVVLDLNLHARKPVIDQLEYGEKHIQGRVTATFEEWTGPR